MTSRRGAAGELEVKVLCYTAGERAIERHWCWRLEEQKKKGRERREEETTEDGETEEGGRREVSAEGLGGTRWETHAAHTHTHVSSQCGRSQTMTP